MLLRFWMNDWMGCLFSLWESLLFRCDEGGISRVLVWMMGWDELCDMV
ncbi:hypothetical protein [Candidatus Hodgkinia cicadicola]